MNKESLMAMGLTEEQAAKVMEGLNGSFVTKARFNEVNTELTKAKATITERDGQLETLKKSGADATALQAQITQLQADDAQKDKDHAAEMRKMRVDHAVDSALSDAKAINPATVKPLLAAFLEKAELSDDGTVKGLSDEIAKLVKGEGTSFLFRPFPVLPLLEAPPPRLMPRLRPMKPVWPMPGKLAILLLPWLSNGKPPLMAFSCSKI